MTNRALHRTVTIMHLVDKVKSQRFKFERTSPEFYTKCYIASFGDIKCERNDNVYHFSCGNAKTVIIENDVFGKDE